MRQWDDNLEDVLVGSGHGGFIGPVGQSNGPSEVAIVQLTTVVRVMVTYLFFLLLALRHDVELVAFYSDVEIPTLMTRRP